MDSTLSKGEQAKQLFLAGHNCAQPYFWRLAKTWAWTIKPPCA
jgi:hypothetical protein